MRSIYTLSWDTVLYRTPAAIDVEVEATVTENVLSDPDPQLDQRTAMLYVTDGTNPIDLTPEETQQLNDELDSLISEGYGDKEA